MKNENNCTKYWETERKPGLTLPGKPESEQIAQRPSIEPNTGVKKSQKSMK